MDPFSLTTGVVGLLAIIAQVTDSINSYVGALQDRKQDIQDLYQELLLLRNVLTQFQDFVISEKAKDTSFDANSVLGTAISDCSRRLERVGDKLKIPSGDKFTRTVAKLKWPFEQDEIRKLNTSLQRFVQTFSFALTVQGLTVLSRTSDSAEAALKQSQENFHKMLEVSKQFGLPIVEQEKMSAQLDDILLLLPTLGQAAEIKEINQQLRLAGEREQARRKAGILEWLVPAATLQRHVKTQKQRASNTCEWFLRSEQFQKWHDLSFPPFDLLCTGNPGVGKTILASFAFDHIRTLLKSEEAAVLIYYCSHSDEDTQTPVSFAKSLLRQICQSQISLPGQIIEFYQRTRHDVQDILWSQELQSVLKSIASNCRSIFIILDALDEIEDVRQRNGMLSVLKDIRSEHANLRILTTTRPHLSNLQAQFLTPSLVNISAQQSDVERMLVQKLEAHPDFEFFDDSSLKAEVVSKLCLGSSGNFLLPSLQLDHILEQVTRADVRLALENLSQTLDEAFRTSIDRISARPPARKVLAFRSMMWISHAKRPLEMTELQHALAIREESIGKDVDPDNIVPSRIILDSCSGLVQVEEGTVDFVHSSLYEYLASTASSVLSETIDDCEVQTTRASLAYLMQASLKKLSFMNTDNFARAVEKFPFLRYAANVWGIHARHSNAESYSDLALSLFDSSMHLITITRVQEMDFPYARKWETEATSWAYSGGAGISIAASFGLSGLVQLLLSQCKDCSVINRCRNRYGNTALQDAATWGHTEVCKILVSHGADLTLTNKSGATAFYQAVAYQRIEVARELLKHHRGQLDICCRDGGSPLHKAADLGDQEMVQFLLSNGALFAAQNDAEMTPLHLAANRGHSNIVQLLVLAGTDVNATSHKTKLTPLCLASTCGHIEVIRYLLAQGAMVNHKGADSWVPLFRASRGGHIESVEILLEGGANVLHVDYYKNTCLHLAVRSGELELVRTLLAHDHRVRRRLLERKDAQHRTAQQIALTTAHIDVYKYLRDLQHQLDAEAGAQIDVYDPLVPLALSIEAQDLAAVETIVGRSPELVNCADNSDQLPIHLAFIECAAEIASFLLASGASIHSQGFHSWQPIHIAASLGSLEMVELALSHGANVNALTGTLQTPLLKASSANSVPVLRRLLEAGADPWARNDINMTCLHVLASKDFIDGICELLQPEWGAQRLVHARDKNKRLPRFWAERSGKYETVRFLHLQEKLISNTITQGQSSTRSPAELSRKGSTVSSSSIPTRATFNRTSSSHLESNEKFTQMVLELDSD